MIPNFNLYLTDWNEIFVRVHGIDGLKNPSEAYVTIAYFEWKYRTDMSESLEAFKKQELFANYSPKIATWALETIQKKSAQTDPDQHDSAFRMALKGNKQQEERYWKITDCCGVCDFEAVCPIDGNTYLLGFNYGH